MRKFSELVIKESKKIESQDNTVNYLTVEQLRQYLEIADKFISKETKDICQWLIDNNDNYIEKLGGENSDNAIASFYNRGVPADDSLKKLYSNISTVYNTGRILEIPTLLSDEQFDAIINKKSSPDEIIIDLETEAGRTAVIKKYDPLVHKIVNSWVGKTSLSYEELYSYGQEGLVRAMNTYGKKSNKQKKREEKTGEEIDISKYKEYTFLRYAAQMIRVWILEGIKDDSHLVRIPRSQQQKQRDEKGFIAKSNSISGDKNLGSKDGGDGKTLFDLVGGIENPTSEMDKREINSFWDSILDELGEKFGKKTMEIFTNHFGFGLKNGEKKLTGKEMAKKYGYTSPSSITAEVTKVLNFIRKDKGMYKRFVEINDLMRESKHDDDEYAADNEPIYINAKLREERMYGFKNTDEWD